MAPQYALPTRLSDYTAFYCPGHTVISSKPSATSSRRSLSNKPPVRPSWHAILAIKKPAVKRLARLLHNERLDPRLLADAVLLQALHQLPKHGKVRLAIDWTIEADQHLLVVSLLLWVVWRMFDLLARL